MGTSAFDVIAKQQKPSSPNKGGGPISAFDAIKPAEQDNNTYENDSSGIGHTLSSFIHYIGSLPNQANGPLPMIPPTSQQQENASQSQQTALSSLKQVGINALSEQPKELSKVFGAASYIKNTPFSQMKSDLKDKISNFSLPQGGDSFTSGIFNTFVQKPIETLTQTINDNGVARPATVQEQTQNLQAAAGMVAQIGVFKLAKLAMLGDAEKAASGLVPSSLGPIAVSGGVKQGLKYVASEGAAGAISGGVGASISSMGQDHQAEQVIGASLSYLPLTIALGTLGVKGYVNDIKEVQSGIRASETLNSTHEIAAVNSLRINPSDPIYKLANNIDAVSSADNLVKAAIRAKLEVGDGYIAQDVSPELGEQLASGSVPSSKSYPDNYIPPSDLRKPRPRPNSTEVRFDSPFDKLAYLASSKKPSPFVNNLIEDAIQQTGLSRDEIISHGQYVKAQQLSQFKNSKLIPRTQSEIDTFNNQALQNGQKIVAALPDGGTVKDSNGNTWTRVGNSVTNQDKTQVLPLDQNNTLSILGRKKSDIAFYQPYQVLGKQVFNPNFNRFDISKNIGQDIKHYYSPTNGSLLVTPINYRPDAVAFFKKTGFMQKEIVNYGGIAHLVQGFDSDNNQLILKNINDGSVTQAPTEYLRRTNYSITPNVNNGGVAAPVLNSETFLDKLYPKFRDAYNSYQEDNDNVSFGAFASKFYSSMGIKSNDFDHITSIFTKKLSDDIANQSLTPEELSIRSGLMADISKYKTQDIEDHAQWLARQAESNGLFYSPEGNGVHRLRYVENGKTFALVSDQNEALNAINIIRQNRGQPLDGGYTGPVPPALANIGGLASSYTPDNYGIVEKHIDISRMTGLLSKIAPVGRMLQGVDNLTEGKSNSSFFPSFLKVQEALIRRRNIVVSDPDIADLRDNFQSALDYGSKFNAERRGVMADNLDAMSIPDIKEKYLTRSMNNNEDNVAQELAKSGDVGKIQDLLYQAKTTNPQATVGSQAYMTTLLDIINKDNTITPEVSKATNLFAGIIGKNPDPNIFSGDAVLRLAQAYENPSGAISQIEHARKYNLTAQEIKYVNMVQDAFKAAAPVAGIDPASQFRMYLPSIRQAFISGSKDAIPEEFAREMTRVGITPKNQLIRDPNVLMAKYFTALVNHQSEFIPALNEFRDNITKDIDNFKGTALEPAIPSFKTKMMDYVNQMYGYKINEDALWNVGKQVAAKLGMKTIDLNSVINFMSAGALAGKPVLAIRDFHNVMALSYTSFGLEFTRRAFANALSDEYVQALKDKHILPESMNRSIIDPMVDESSLISNNSLSQRIIRKGFSLSGQELSYERANAGVYKASMEMAEKYFKQLQDNKITKDEAFDKIGLSSNYGPGLIKQVDDLLTQGQTDKAADLYSQANMRFVSNVYGLHNNPIGWNTTFGRLMSQWGSWSANASQTFLDQMFRGNKKQLAAKLTRYGMVNAATIGVGSALGFNLGSWAVSNPLTVWPTTGPIINMMGDISDQYNRGLSVTGILGDAALNFVPYSQAAIDWTKGLDQIGQGNLIQGLFKMGGGRIAQ